MCGNHASEKHLQTFRNWVGRAMQGSVVGSAVWREAVSGGVCVIWVGVRVNSTTVANEVDGWASKEVRSNAAVRGSVRQAGDIPLAAQPNVCYACSNLSFYQSRVFTDQQQRVALLTALVQTRWMLCMQGLCVC